MQLVIKNPKKTRKNPGPWIIVEKDSFYANGRSLRKILEDAAKELDGQPGYLVFDKDDEAQLLSIFEHLHAITHPVNLVAQLINQTVCENKYHQKSPEMKVFANFFYADGRWLQRKGFWKGKSKYPFAFWINLERVA